MSSASNDTATPIRTFSRGAEVFHFGSVYLIWGSTYLAIRVAVETMPPFLMAGTRFLFAGICLFLWLKLRGAAWPKAVHWRSSAIIGTLLLLGGNGLVCWAEQHVPSGIAALVVATQPMWFMLFDALRPGGAKPTALGVLGLLVGFSGVVILATGRSMGGTEIPLAGILGLLAACLCWSGGSVFGKQLERPPSPLMGSALQMICGGTALTLVAMLRGEPAAMKWEAVSSHAILAWVYLVVFGSWVAFGSYVWLLEHVAPAKVATYAYVNPAIAVLLGWMFVNEPITWRTVAAMLVIIGGVVIVQWPKNGKRT